LQYAKPLMSVSWVHFILNVLLVVGSFFILIGVIETNGTVLVEMYFLVTTMYWILARIVLSDLEHQRICKMCASSLCGYRSWWKSCPAMPRAFDKLFSIILQSKRKHISCIWNVQLSFPDGYLRARRKRRKTSRKPLRFHILDIGGRFLNVPLSIPLRRRRCSLDLFLSKLESQDLQVLRCRILNKRNPSWFSPFGNRTFHKIPYGLTQLHH